MKHLGKEDLKNLSKEELLDYIDEFNDWADEQLRELRYEKEELEEEVEKLGERIDFLERENDELNDITDNSELINNESIAHQSLYETILLILEKYSPQKLEQILNEFITRDKLKLKDENVQKLLDEIEELEESNSDLEDQINDLENENYRLKKENKLLLKKQ